MPGSKVLRSGWLFTYHALCSIDGCVLAFGAFKILPMSVADDWGSHEAPEFGKVLLVGLHELPVVGTLFTGVACGFHVVVGGLQQGVACAKSELTIAGANKRTEITRNTLPEFA